MMMGHEGGMFFGGIVMWLFWLLIIIAVIVVLRSVLGKGSPDGASRTDTPLEILQKRYARGEIDDEEYKRRRRELEE